MCSTLSYFNRIFECRKKYILNFNYFKNPVRLLVIYTICAAICSIPKFTRGELGGFFVSLFEFKAAPYAWYLVNAK